MSSIKLSLYKLINIIFFTITLFNIFSINKIYAYDSNLLGSYDSLGTIHDIHYYKDNKIIIVSQSNNYLIVNTLDNSTSEIKELSKTDIGQNTNLKVTHYVNNNLYILCRNEPTQSIGTPENNTIIYKFDIENPDSNSTSTIAFCSPEKGKFCIDKSGNYYYIDGKNSNNIIIKNPYDNTESTIVCDYPVTSINITPNEDVLLLSYFGNNASASYSLKNSDWIEKQIYCAPYGNLFFLDEYNIVDKFNYLYEINSSFSEIKKVSELIPKDKFYDMCLTNDKIISCDGVSSIYTFDRNTKKLNDKAFIDSDEILIESINDNILVISRKNNFYFYYTLEVSDFESIEDIILTKDSGEFTFVPQSGEYPDNLLSAAYKWTVSLSENISINEYDNLIVKIIDNNNNQAYELTIGNGVNVENSKIIISPPGITFDTQYSFDISIEGLQNAIGLPCKIEHHLELIYKTTNPSDYYINSSYNIDYKNNLITGVYPHTSISTFKKQFSLKGYEMVIYNSDGTTASSGYIGTGKRVVFIRNGIFVHNFTVIIFGDLNGNGNINNNDLNLLTGYLLGKFKLSGAFLIAADINHDKKIDSIDLLLLSEYIDGTAFIDQRFSEVD